MILGATAENPAWTHKVLAKPYSPANTVFFNESIGFSLVSSLAERVKPTATDPQSLTVPRIRRANYEM